MIHLCFSRSNPLRKLGYALLSSPLRAFPHRDTHLLSVFPTEKGRPHINEIFQTRTASSAIVLILSRIYLDLLPMDVSLLSFLPPTLACQTRCT